MEKRRRARINASLTELKSLLLDAIKREGARQNKMEKADILEMAVNHLRHIQRQQFTGESSRDTSDVNKYQLGFHACVQEVCKYLDSNSDEDLKLKTKLLNHLANCINSTDHQATSSTSSQPHLLQSTSSNNQLPSSPTSSTSLSPSMISQTPELRLTSSAATPPTVGNNELSQTNAIINMQTSKGNTTSGPDVIHKAGISSTSDGILHAVLTSSSPSVLVKPHMVSWLTQGAVLSPSASVSVKHADTTTSMERPGQIIAPPVKEINNNSVILPTVVSVASSPTISCLQQSSQLQPSYLFQQQQVNQLQLQQLIHQPQLHQLITQSQLNQAQPSQPQLQHQMPTHFPSTLLDSSNIFSSINPIQLIPTKRANGEIVFLLSATNLINPSNPSSFTIPVLAPQTVDNAQIITSPQQAFQIALPCPPDEKHQSVTFISPHFLPLINSSNQSCSNMSSFTTSQEITPLNLSLTSNQSTKITNQQMLNQNIAFSNSASNVSDSQPSLNQDVLSIPTLTASSEGNSHQSFLIGNVYQASNTGMGNQTRLDNRDVQGVSYPGSLVSRRPRQSTSEGEASERLGKFFKTTGLMLGQSQPRQQTTTERQRCGTERSSIETERQRLERRWLEPETHFMETERQRPETERSPIERRWLETETHSIETESQHPETERLPIETERQRLERRWLETETHSMETNRQRPGTESLPMETERHRPETGRSPIETERQRLNRRWLETEAHPLERQRHETDTRRLETERQRMETARHHPETERRRLETETMFEETNIFRPWRQ